MTKSKKNLIFMSLISTTPLLTIATISCASNQNQQQVKDLPLSQIQQIYDSFDLEIKNPQVTFEEFKQLFTQKYTENNNDIYKTFKDSEIQNIIATKLIDINKIQPGHEVIIAPKFNSTTQQFILNIKVRHIQGSYIEGKEEGNDTIAKGQFKLFSAQDKLAQQKFINQYAKDIVFKLKDNVNKSDILNVLDENKLTNSEYVFNKLSKELTDKITFNLPQNKRPHDTVLAFNIDTSNSQIKLVILLKNARNSEEILLKTSKSLD
ncbi:hypothetical protein [Mycoplasma miroungirhinis]|uniref:Lipoprotein n=1 Tax=Mycoplasma miroungirhinis TaxID=754516 RepID=A0A6M4JHA2_9MOLU|nr:hypothetical protein [Mycoplasma miroungirhinis]QJR44402.1 hypothetical protein HLA92_03110 [Mycoplasma miroungirhinis]